jgi:hypothetical protein
MSTKQSQVPVLATYGRVLLNPLAAKVGGGGKVPGKPQK